ncbi:MAG: DsbA family protein [Steroidobacteraceae bacterium]
MNTTQRTATLAVPVSVSDHSVGPEHAAVTVLEYGDFECPICLAVEPAVQQLREVHRAQMRFVFRHFPLEDAHPHALMAAEAAEAAAAQGQFWPMHDRLLRPNRQLDRRHLDTYAAEIGLDAARFRADLDDEVYRQRVREHQDGGRRSILRATPAFFVNGVVQDVSGGMHELFDLVAAEIQRLSRR